MEIENIYVEEENNIYDCKINITKEEWIELLKDRNIFSNERLDAILRWYKSKNYTASCSEIADKTIKSYNYFNNQIWQLGKAVIEKLNRFRIVSQDGNERFWIVVMIGKSINNYFEWTLRKELVAAIDEIRFFESFEPLDEINKDSFDINSYKMLIEEYKKSFDTNIKNELYKWKAIKTFQDNWNIDAENFAEMLKNSFKDTDNLLLAKMYYPKQTIIEMAEKEPQTVKEMFATLFNENDFFVDKYDYFERKANELLKKYYDKGKNNYQDKHAISTYIMLMYPEKYYVYKYSVMKKATDLLDIEIHGGSASVELLEYFKFVEKINKYVRQDEELIKKLNMYLDDTMYNDPEYTVLTMDFIYFIGAYYTTKKYWLISSGENSSQWNNFKENSIISIGWDKLGDLNNYSSQKEIKTALDKFNYTVGNSSSKNNLKAIDDFKNKMQIGDIVYVKNTMSHILAKGIIKSSCYFDNNKNEYKNCRKVLWEDENYNYNMQNKKLPIKVLTEITNNKEILNEILENEKGNNVIMNNENKLYTKSDFLNDVYISDMEYEKIVNVLKRKKNLILKGAPGVGKTFMAKRIAYSIMGEIDTTRVKSIQFHQSYSYEDFIEGYRPKDNGFEIEKGIFYNFCKEAENNPQKDYFFIIDEINRGNLSKIFGELLMLIESDKRGERLELAYSKSDFSVPSNLYIIGMMNTADRSLAMIDYALRRRFAFYTVNPAFNSVKFIKYQILLANKKFNKAIEVIKELNKEIVEDTSLGNGFEIGHSYFCNLKNETLKDDDIESIIEYEIVPLIEEYWFDDEDKCNEWKEKLYGVLNG